MEKNYVKVNTIQKGYRYYLEIELDRLIDSDWKDCYNRALSSKTFTSMWGTGAPTVYDVSFYGKLICSTDFGEFAKDDAKSFLNEINEVIGIANGHYAMLMKQKEAERERVKKEEEAKSKKLADLNDFFNDR